jgi:hypothetical protein
MNKIHSFKFIGYFSYDVSLELKLAIKSLFRVKTLKTNNSPPPPQKLKLENFMGISKIINFLA